MISTTEEFVRLRTSDNPQEYLRAARDTAPIELWRDVIARFPEMRFWVVHNKTVPSEILEELAGDGDPNVRIAVATKNSLTHSLFLKLAQDLDPAVRYQVLQHKNLPRAVLDILKDDTVDQIRSSAAERLQHLSRP